MMGDMSGEISIAPMITAVELTLSPTEATTIAKIRTQRFAPRNSAPSRRRRSMDSSSARSASRLKSERRPPRLGPFGVASEGGFGFIPATEV